MRNKFYLLVLLFLLIQSFLFQANAQMVLIPDSNFRNALIANGFGSCISGNYIDSTCSQVLNCDTLQLYNPPILDLTGIEAFVNLIYLDCQSNQISQITALPHKLSTFYCNNNQLTTLPPLPDSLEMLICKYNMLTSLPALPSSLETLECQYNQLTNIPPLGYRLQGLECQHNLINHFSTMAAATSMGVLNCSYNQLASNSFVDIAPFLDVFDCSYNQLTAASFPPLSNSIQEMNCSFNQLTSLPPLPIYIGTLECQNNFITQLPTITSLLHLNCSNNYLTNLTVLPLNLSNLNCSYNHLTNLPALPLSLNNLYCNNNFITTLPGMPLALQSIDCSHNFISQFPSVPPNLLNINCNFNQLTTIPLLPNGSTATFTNNAITYLPEFPDSLNNFYCSNNPNLSCLPKLKKINYFDFSNTNVTCLSNYGQVLTCNPSLSTIPLCGYFNPNSCNFYWNISGKTYFDADSNCIFSTGDIAESNIKVKLYKNGILQQQVYSGGEGFYSFDTNGLDIFTSEIDTIGIPLEVRCPSSIDYIDTLTITDSLKYNDDFSLKCKSGFDLAAWSVHANGFRPGNNVKVKIDAGDFSNLFGAYCATGINGSLSVILNGPVTYVTNDFGSLLPNVNGNIITYTINDFDALNFDNAFVFYVSVDTSATSGTLVTISATISPLNDNNPTDNYIANTFIIHSSFDPNEKSVSPQNVLDQNGDHWLTYNIDFQNTGTAAAEDIRIVDTLNSNLDWSTFTLLGYSKQPYVQILPGGVAQFTFIHIGLPDSSANEPYSHGYVQYKIKAKDSLPIGTIISNNANIYFDYNLPVVTNTVTNSIIYCTPNIQNTSVIICGLGYDFGGVYLTQSGNYTYTFHSISGCDSTVNLSLQLNPTYSINRYETICAGSSFQFGSNTISQAGIYADHLTTVLGCDSTIILNLNIISKDTTLTASICDSTYDFNGQSLSVSGLYTDSLLNQLGCDSIITLNLYVATIDTSVTRSNDTLYSASTNAYYIWINCATNHVIPGIHSRYYVPTVSGNYSVYSHALSCSGLSACHFISLTGVKENILSGISISPNPFNEMFIIDCPFLTSNNQNIVAVYDALGNLIESKKLVTGKIIFNASNWASGIYFLRVSLEDGRKSVQKIIKQ